MSDKMENENTIEVSIVLPVYNGDQFIKLAVDSILKQTFRKIELIVVNDGSTDNTSTILHSYRDNRLKLIERENRGFAASLNEAISVSQGKYIARMDADDIAYKDRLEKQFRYMEEHPEIDILGGQASIIDENGKVTGEMTKPDCWGQLSQYIQYACPICHPTYFVRKHVYTQTHGYRSMPPVEDYDFLFRAFEAGFKMTNLAEKILQYRQLSTSMSSHNAQRTVFLTEQVQKMHKVRMSAIHKEEHILKKISEYNRSNGLWFKTVYSNRNKLMRIRKKQTGLPRIVTAFLVLLISVFHIKVLQNTINGFRSLRLKEN